MNNTKWREVFEILIEQDLKACTWHFLNDDSAYQWSLPLVNEIKRDGIADGNWCPTPYKKIEKVCIPKIYEHHRGLGLTSQLRKNDLQTLQKSLQTLGQLDMDNGEDKIVIHGYRLNR